MAEHRHAATSQRGVKGITFMPSFTTNNHFHLHGLAAAHVVATNKLGLALAAELVLQGRVAHHLCGARERTERQGQVWC